MPPNERQPTMNTQRIANHLIISPPLGSAMGDRRPEGNTKFNHFYGVRIRSNGGAVMLGAIRRQRAIKNDYFTPGPFFATGDNASLG